MILQAAAQVFERQGYARATTNRIAERAGVSIGSLYQYFPGKDAILVAIAQRHADAGVQQVRELLSAAGGAEGLRRASLRAIIRLFIQQLVELHQSHPRLHRLLFVEAPMHREQHDRLSRAEDELALEITALLEQHPEVAAPLPKLTAWVLLHTVHGLVHDFIVHPPPGRARRDDFVAELTNMLHAYLVADTRQAERGTTPALPHE